MFKIEIYYETTFSGEPPMDEDTLAFIKKGLIERGWFEEKSKIENLSLDDFPRSFYFTILFRGSLPFVPVPGMCINPTPEGLPSVSISIPEDIQITWHATSLTDGYFKVAAVMDDAFVYPTADVINAFRAIGWTAECLER